MGYVLGVDLGTTYTAAAVCSDGRAEIISLGNKAPVMPSVVLLRADGEVLTGEAAERRGLSEPSNTAREFKRRLGDSAPLLLGGTPYGVETLTAHLLRAVVSHVVELRGERPDRIVVCHPASYRTFKLDLLEQAARIAEVGDVSFVSEPVAAAVHYASQERVLPGEHIAVYDFGGGTFDAAVLRKTDAGFELLGTPEGLERLGGIDFDQAVFAHVAQALGGAIDELDSDDQASINALAHLREQCREAKEALSIDTDAQIPVLLPNVQTEVRLTRAEFEGLLRPRISETVAALQRAIRSADLHDDDIARILLVGGSSRIPLVGQLVREGTGRPTALDAHPKHAVALGAALFGSAEVLQGPGAVMATPEPALTSGSVMSVSAVDAAPARRRGLLVGLVIGVILAVAGAAFALSGGEDSPTTSEDAGSPTSATQTSVTTTTVEPTTSTSTTTATSSAPSPPSPSPSPLGGIGGALGSGKLVTIASADVEADHYVIEFSTAGFEPSTDVDGSQVRFYFVRSSDIAALVNGAAVAEVYEDYAGSSPFTGLEVADRPSGADQLCGAVVDNNGAPPGLSGTCVLIPS